MSFDAVAYRKQWAKDNAIKTRAYSLAWRTKNKEKIDEIRDAHRDEINRKARERFSRNNKDAKHASARAWYHRNKDSHKEKTKARNMARRMRALSHYSNGTMACACCPPQSNMPVEFLCIDHLDKRPRGFPKLGGGGYSLYLFLERSGYPPGFRVLCHNCNLSLGFYGYCPHQRI